MLLKNKRKLKLNKKPLPNKTNTGTKMKDWIKHNIIDKVYSTANKDYNSINDDEYYRSFGLEKDGDKWKIKKPKKIKSAYNRAWENRDFEINKFWTRAAYFWGFIVLIFGAYFTIIDKKEEDEFIQLILICLGIVFSIAWHYVIRGSKRWQENWETHIDKLEDYVSGPLYKTIFHKDTFYSVSKINEILSVVVLAVWLALLWNFLDLNNSLPWNENASKSPDFKTIIPLIITVFVSIVIICGYSRKKYDNEKNRFIRRKPSA
jgi:hypothetical protein